MAKAPVRRGSTAATASWGEAPRSTSRATRWPTTSVSVSLSNLRPSPISSSRSGLKFSMIPLCTSATDPTMCGWALPTVGAPCVAQRVCAMPVVPCSGCAASSRARLSSLPSARRRTSSPPSIVQMPAESYPRYSSRLSPSNRRCATSDFPTIPTIPHIRLLRRLARHPLTETLGPAGYALLLVALDREAVGLDIAGDDRSGADNRAVADGHRCDQRGVRADERSGADHCLVLAEAVVIAGDGARTDVGARADLSVADIRQMINLGAVRHDRFLELDEIADLGSFAETGAGADPSEGPDIGPGADRRALDVAERLDHCPVGDCHARAEHDVRLDRHIAAKLRVVCEPHAFRVDQGRAFVEHLLAPASLPFEFEMGELGAAVDARRFIRIALDHHRIAALLRGDVDDVGQVIFACGIVVADLAQPAEKIRGAHRHHAGIAQADGTLVFGRVTIFDHPRDMVAFAKDDAAVFARVVRLGGEHHHARAAVAVEPVDHSTESFGLDERRVAVKDQDRPVVARKRVRRLLHGVACAPLLGLDGDRHVAAGDRRLDLLAPLADDDDTLVGAEAVHAIEQMEKQ